MARYSKLSHIKSKHLGIDRFIERGYETFYLAVQKQKQKDTELTRYGMGGSRNDAISDIKLRLSCANEQFCEDLLKVYRVEIRKV